MNIGNSNINNMDEVEKSAMHQGALQAWRASLAILSLIQNSLSLQSRQTSEIGHVSSTGLIFQFQPLMWNGQGNFK